MTSKIIEVTVSPTGETRVETKGFAGSTCREASQFLEQVLGEQASEQLTSEFYTGTSVQQQLYENS